MHDRFLSRPFTLTVSMIFFLEIEDVLVITDCRHLLIIRADVCDAELSF